MPFELVKEKVVLDNKAADEFTQIMLEGDVIVPDIKPDISFILRIEGRPVLEEKKVMDDKAVFSGQLKFTILYQAKKAEKLIHSMKSAIPFEDYINIDGLDKTDELDLWAKLEYLDYKLINDRKINIKALITVKALVQRQDEMYVIKDVEEAPQIQTRKGVLNVCNVVDEKRDRFVIKEQVNVPAGRPNVREVLQCDVKICQKEVRPLDGRVSVKGVLDVCTLYMGDNDESIIEIMENEVPFSGYIESKDVTEGMMASAALSVGDQKVTVLPDDDGEERVLDIETTVLADMTVRNNEDIEVVEDVYSLDGPLDVTKQPVRYSQFVGNHMAQGNLKETIVIDGKYPDMMQVQKVWGTAEISDTEMEGDTLLVDGVINMEVMYIVEDDSAPVNIVPVAVPFEQEIEIKGADSGDCMSIDAAVDVENISFNMLSNREVEIRCTLNFDVFATRDVEDTMITDITPSTDGVIGAPAASVIIYVVQKGDSLWTIAKKYCTTVDDILMINDIENPDKIYPGQKILILKRTA